MKTALPLLVLLLALPACPAGGPTREPRVRALPRAFVEPPRAEPTVSDLVRDQVRRHRRRLRRCHELALAEDRRIGGLVRLALTVPPMGVVTAVLVVENATGSRVLSACLTEVARGMVFPAGDAVQTVPVSFRFTAPEVKLTVRLDDAAPLAGLGAGVSAKVVLSPRSVTGDRISLSVVRLAAGSSVGVPGISGVAGLHVLRGVVSIGPTGARTALGAGQGGASRAGTLELTGGATGGVALLFLAPAGPEAVLRAGRPLGLKATPSPARPQPLVPASPFTGPVLRLRGIDAPAPQLVVVPRDQPAVVNPEGAALHHALLVTEGSFSVTVLGVTLPAEPGMAVYVPGGQPARLQPLHGAGGSFVVFPWPGQGGWDRTTRHTLVRVGL